MKKKVKKMEDGEERNIRKKIRKKKVEKRRKLRKDNGNGNEGKKLEQKG